MSQAIIIIMERKIDKDFSLSSNEKTINWFRKHHILFLKNHFRGTLEFQILIGQTVMFSVDPSYPLVYQMLLL